MKQAVFFAMWLTISLCATGGAQADSKPRKVSLSDTTQVVSTPAKNRAISDFEASITALSQKYHIAFVCESAPYKPNLSPEAASTLRKTIDTTPALSKQDEINAVALAYDYNTVFKSDHVVLLIKRYSEPKDLPEITLDEAVLFLNNMMAEAAPYGDPSGESGVNFNQKIHGVMIDLYKEATPKQKALYAHGVQWGSMPADVQARFAYSRSAISPIPLGAFWSASSRLNGVKMPNATVFKMTTYWGISIPAYVGPFHLPKYSDNREVVLGEYLKTNIGGAIKYEPPTPGVVENGKVINPPVDPATPSAAELSAPPKSLLTHQKTIAQTAKEINTRIAKNGSESDAPRSVEIPFALAEKTVSLFGAESYLSPLEETKAIAEVYGLRGVQTQDAVATILMPRAVKVLDPTQYWIEALHALPAPLYRALRGPRPMPSDIEKSFPVGKDQINPDKARPIYVEAVKRLRVIVDPKITEGKILPLTQAPAEAKNLIALSTLVDIASWLNGVRTQPVPPLTNQIKSRSTATFKMFQEGDIIKYQFIDGNGIGTASFPVPKP